MAEVAYDQPPPASVVTTGACGASDGVGVVRRDTVTVDDGDTVWCGDGLTLAGGCATERSRL